MRRRVFLVACGTVLASAGRSRAQRKVPRLGYVWIGPEGSDGATLGGVRHGLQELGYVERRTFVLERRYADGDPERLPVLLAELLAIPVDVILSPGTLVTRSVRAATTTIPVVATTGDPVVAGLAASLSRPGGNITGLSLGSAEAFAGKWLELLTEAVPGLSRVAVLYDSTNQSTSSQQLETIKRPAAQLDLELAPVSVSAAEELEPALAKIAAISASGLIVSDSPLFAAMRERITGFATAHRLPAIYGLEEFVPAGGLMSYSSSVFSIWKRAAGYVDRILKGASPAEMPIEQPTAYELKINLRTARALGLKLPPTLLRRADEVIE